MRRLLPLMTLPVLLFACTQSELNQVFPDRNAPPVAAAPITVVASNPGSGGSPCKALTVAVYGTQATLATSPSLALGGEWSKVISSDQLEAVKKITVELTCIVETTDAEGNTTPQTGFSLTEHPTATTAQTLRITGPREKPNLEGRIEWARPVPGILPLDP